MLNHPWQQCDFNSYVEILASSSKTSLTIEKPDNVQILEDPYQSKPQDSSEFVVGPDSKELLLSSKEVISELKKEFIMKAWASICTKLVGLTPNRASSIQNNVKVILNDMSGMGVDIYPLQNLLGSFFGLATFYDQARSALVNKTIKIKESEPYLKAKEHLKIVLRERDEKYKEVSTSYKSLEKARKKVKKLKARRDAAKQEAVEMESNVTTAEEEFPKYSDVSLVMKNASKVMEKKKQVLEVALQDLVNYKLYLDYP
ncbi:hypothetical protein CQW23_14614 [Capsicum baccatum]|uniref:Uncharacterized protein n=1 Tax=Capsicum baccatum TaxID=33114 RepID=A0A2G2WJN5_CAPBA|nr:hypothetical protein CQW23_14614 [Capsicum baccatum]